MKLGPDDILPCPICGRDPFSTWSYEGGGKNTLKRVLHISCERGPGGGDKYLPRPGHMVLIKHRVASTAIKLWNGGRSSDKAAVDSFLSAVGVTVREMDGR